MGYIVEDAPIPEQEQPTVKGTYKLEDAPPRQKDWRDVVQEPFKLAGEAAAGTVNAFQKGFGGAAGTIAGAASIPWNMVVNRMPYQEAEAKGLKTAQSFIPQKPLITPPQSMTSQFLGENVIEPGVNWLGQKTGRPDLVRTGLEAAGDITSLLGVKPGLSSAGKLAGKGLAKVTTPEWLYGKALNTPTSAKWVKELGKEGISARKEAIRAGIEGEVPISELGLTKAKNLEKAYRSTVDSAIAKLDADGTLIPKEQLKKGLAEAQGVADIEGTAKAQSFVDRLYDKRFNKMGKLVKVGEKQIPAVYKTDPMGGKILVEHARVEPIMQRKYSPSEVQRIKRHLYKMENYEKTQLSRGLGSMIKELGNKGMASQARQALENLYPDLKRLNRQDAAYINLVEALQNRIPKLAQKDVLDLGGKVMLASKMPMLAAFEYLTGLPGIEAKLAFALNKARKAPYSNIAANAAKSAAAAAGGEAMQREAQDLSALSTEELLQMLGQK